MWIRLEQGRSGRRYEFIAVNILFAMVYGATGRLLTGLAWHGCDARGYSALVFAFFASSCNTGRTDEHTTPWEY